MNIFSHVDSLRPVRERESLGGLVDTLRRQPEIEPSEELTGRVMRSIDREPVCDRATLSEQRGFQPWFGAAAAVAVVIVLLALRYTYTRVNVCGVAGSDEQWLARRQERDGSWNPARHGGSQVYQPALTALSALALHRSAVDYESEVKRARNYLMRIQHPDGTFGGNGRESMYNQSIVTYVLAVTGDGSAAALSKSVNVIKRRQSAAGGWDYVKNSEGNAAITSWFIQALAAAGGAGVDQGEVSMRKGLRWLRGLADQSDRVAYNKSSPAGSDTISALAGYALLTAGAEFADVSELGQRIIAAMRSETPARGGDLYRDCMKVRALTAAGHTKDAAALKHSVASRNADAAGDQWEKVGGALYLTSMHSLASTY